MLEPFRSTWYVISESFWLMFLCVFLCRRAIHGPEVQQQPMGQEESELPSDKELDSPTLTSFQSQQGGLSATGKKTQRELRCFFKSPQCFELYFAGILFEVISRIIDETQPPLKTSKNARYAKQFKIAIWNRNFSRWPFYKQWRHKSESILAMLS